MDWPSITLNKLQLILDDLVNFFNKGLKRALKTQLIKIIAKIVIQILVLKGSKRFIE